MARITLPLPTRAAAVALGIGLALAGCSREPIEGALPAVSVPKVSRVDWRVEQHPVYFGVGSPVPAGGEQQRLDGFLAGFEPYGARVFVDAAPDVTGAGLAEGRLKTLTEVARRRGFTVERFTPTAEMQPTSRDPRIAQVFVGRFVVTSPACPDWRKDSAADFTNTPTSNYGCADVVNLGAMLADPGDLVRGRDMGPAEAERAGLAIQRYRGYGSKESQRSEQSHVQAQSTKGDNSK